MEDQDLEARLAASRARSLGNIRRAREAILNQMRENERLAMRGAFEEVFHRRLEDERRELEDLQRQEAVLEAELRRGDTA